MKYKVPDEYEFTYTAKELRKWAEECEEVKTWMKKHIGHDLFTVKVEEVDWKDVNVNPFKYIRIDNEDCIYIHPAVAQACKIGSRVDQETGWYSTHVTPTMLLDIIQEIVDTMKDKR